MTTCPTCDAYNVDAAMACATCGGALAPVAATTTEIPADPTAPYPAAPYATGPAYAPVPGPAPPGPGWWMAADGNWYPPQPLPVPAATPGWVQGADGQWYAAPAAPYGAYPGYYGYGPPKQKVVAALLALFVGSTGAHNFYLGRTNTAVTQLAMLIVGFVTSLIIVGFFILIALSIWVFVEFILILTGGIRDGQDQPLV